MIPISLEHIPLFLALAQRMNNYLPNPYVIPRQSYQILYVSSYKALNSLHNCGRRCSHSQECSNIFDFYPNSYPLYTKGNTIGMCCLLCYGKPYNPTHKI